MHNMLVLLSLVLILKLLLA